MDIVNLSRYFLEKSRTTAALHLDSTCRESLDTVASLSIVVRPTTTSAAFPLAEQIVYAWWPSRIIQRASPIRCRQTRVHTGPSFDP